MKIVIDGRMISWTGIGLYTKRLLEHLQEIDHDNSYIVLLRQADYDLWQPRTPNFQKVLSNSASYSLAEQIALPWQLYRLRPDLVHFVSFNAPVLYFGRRMFTIHDLTLVFYKNIRGRGLARVLYEFKYWAMRLVLRCSVQRSVHLLTPSQYVKDEIVRRYHRDLFKVSPTKITVTHEAVDVGPQPKSAGLPQKVTPPYLLYVGNSYPHKNLSRLITAFRVLSSKFPELQLVLAGPDDQFYRQLQSQAASLGLKDKVLFPGYIPLGQLGELYGQAEIYVFPSLSEGFGLPPLGAMSYGTPVVAADASCLPEILGDAAIYFNPKDPADIADAIEAVLNSPDEVARMRELGPKQAAKYSWRRMAEQTLDVYRKF